MTKPRQSIRHLRLHEIVPHAGNVREAVGDVTDLARSIGEHGILQPLVVTEHPTEYDRWLLLAGHRRLAAAKEAGLGAVPVVIRHGLEEDQAEQILVMLVENCQRKDLGPVEKAEAFGALRNRGLSVSEIGRRSGLHPSTVSYYLNLLLLPADELEQVRNGEIQSTDAIAAVRVHRQAERQGKSTPKRGRPAIVEPPHFGPKHPLAATVQETCEHTTRTKVGRIGCGQCWEEAIRRDAAGDTLGAELRAVTA